MTNTEQMKDILTAYYMNTEDVQDRANYLRLDPEILAEMKAEQAMETEEGVELYNTIVDLLRRDYKGLVNN